MHGLLMGCAAVCTRGSIRRKTTTPTLATSPSALKRRAMSGLSAGCSSAANSTGAVARPDLRSFSAGLPRMEALPVRSSTSSTI